MAHQTFITVGRLFYTVPAFASIIGPYAADFNESHVLNPNWPAHARFHNGQTMSMGVLLGAYTLYSVYRPYFSFGTLGATLGSRPNRAFFGMECAWTAALAGSIYWLTGLSAIFYPGSGWIDAQLVGSKFDLKILGLPGQLPMFLTFLILNWIGYAIELGRLSKMRVVYMPDEKQN